MTFNSDINGPQMNFTDFAEPRLQNVAELHFILYVNASSVDIHAASV